MGRVAVASRPDPESIVSLPDPESPLSSSAPPPSRPLPLASVPRARLPLGLDTIRSVATPKSVGSIMCLDQGDYQTLVCNLSVTGCLFGLIKALDARRLSHEKQFR